MARVYSQPQIGPVQVDYAGLGEGVQILLMPLGGRLVDVANPSVIWTPNGNAGIKATNEGIAAAFDGSGDYFSTTGYPNLTGARGTFFMWAPRVGIAPNYGQVWLVTNTGGVCAFQSPASAGTAYCFGSGAVTGASVVGNSINTSLVFSANTIAGSQRYFRNGLPEGTPDTGATPTAFPSGNKFFNFGRYMGGNSWDADADIVIAGFTTEVWGAAQAKQFHENPWSVFKTPARILRVSTASTNVTITTAIGPATASGVSALRNASLVTDLGSAAAAGVTAQLAAKMPATVGVASAAGATASLSASTVITASVGSAAAAGPNASLSGSITVTAGTGHAEASGASARLNATLVCSVGGAGAAAAMALLGMGIAATVASAAAQGLTAALSKSLIATPGTAAASGVTALMPAAGVTLTATGAAAASGVMAALNVKLMATVNPCAASGVSAALNSRATTTVAPASATGVTATLTTLGSAVIQCTVASSAAAGRTATVSVSGAVVSGEVTLSAQSIDALATAIANAIYSHPDAVTAQGIAAAVWAKTL